MKRRIPFGVTSSSNLPLCALSNAMRFYFWPYNEDFVPQNAPTSSFQSSRSPNTRQRMLQEYALSPLFGARSPCCTLGTLRPPREVLTLKKDIPPLLCELLELPAGCLTLGSLVHTTEMMLYKPNTPLSPRVGNTQRKAYGRSPIAARTLLDVFLPEDADVSEVIETGRLLQQFVQSACAKGAASATGQTASLADVLVHKMGMTYCEMAALDEGGFVFDAICGISPNGDEAERIAQRWEKRCAEMKGNGNALK